MTSAARRVAVIVGCGSKHDEGGTRMDHAPETRFGLGGALSLAFAASESFDHVLLLSRRQALLDLLQVEVEKLAGKDSVSTSTCDVSSCASVKAAFDKACSLGNVECLVFNTAPNFPNDADGNEIPITKLPEPANIDPDQLTSGFDVGVAGCARFANHFIPYFLARGKGTFLVSGATMALRGSKNFACMSPVKFALRSYCQSMSQAYHSRNVHVAHVVIDGVIDSPRTRLWSEAFGMQLMNPTHIAEAFITLHLQPPTVWSHEIMLTPQLDGIGTRL